MDPPGGANCWTLRAPPPAFPSNESTYEVAPRPSASRSIAPETLLLHAHFPASNLIRFRDEVHVAHLQEVGAPQDLDFV